MAKKVRFYTKDELAEEVSNANNNPQLESLLKLYLTPAVLAGFKFCKEVENGASNP